MFAKSVVALAAVAGLVSAAPIEQRGAPAGWAYGYLEDYDTYHVRYLALQCQDKHDTDFFQDCCRPMLSTETLAANRKSYCVPSQEATNYVVSSLSAKAAGYSATPAAAAPSASASEECDTEDADAPASSAAAPSSAATTSSAAASKAAPAVASASPSPSTTSPAAKEYVAPVPSSASTTTTTTQAWTPAPTTQAPAPTTQAPAPTTQAPAPAPAPQSNNAQHSGGFATYFYQGGNAGACGKVNGDYAMIAAIDHEQWGDQSFGSGSNTCGRWLTACNTNNGKCVSVMVADVCPTCANGNSLDLSVGAFKAIANESDGMVPITWSWN